MFDTFHIQSIGADHIAKGKVCQDAVSSSTFQTAGFAIVADGHGGSEYFRSERGSKFLVEESQKCIITFLGEIEYLAPKLRIESEDILRHLAKSIVAAWNERVNNDIVANPFTKDELDGLPEKAKERYLCGEQREEAYGTTLVVAVVTDRFWFGLQQGDGKCIVIDRDGNFSEPIPGDPRCHQNVTTSICDQDAGNSVRLFYSEEIPLAVCVASDGIDDSFALDVDLYGFYKKMIGSFAEGDFKEKCKDWENALADISKRGSGDDMSIAGILDRSAIPIVIERFKREIKERDDQIRKEHEEAAEKKQKWLEQFKESKARREASAKRQAGNGSILANLFEIGSDAVDNLMSGSDNTEKEDSKDIDEQSVNMASDRCTETIYSGENNGEYIDVNEKKRVVCDNNGSMHGIVYEEKENDDIPHILAEEIEPEFSAMIRRAEPIINSSGSVDKSKKEQTIRDSIDLLIKKLLS